MRIFFQLVLECSKSLQSLSLQFLNIYRMTTWKHYRRTSDLKAYLGSWFVLICDLNHADKVIGSNILKHELLPVCQNLHNCRLRIQVDTDNNMLQIWGVRSLLVSTAWLLIVCPGVCILFWTFWFLSYVIHYSRWIYSHLECSSLVKPHSSKSTSTS